MDKNVILFLAAILFLPACEDKDDEETNDLVGYWVLAAETWTEWIDGEIEDSGSDTYSTTDPYAWAQVIRFTADSVYLCENDVLSSAYECVAEVSYEIDGNSLIITEDGEEETVTFSISGDELTISSEYTETYDGATYTGQYDMEFVRYEDDFPPSEWLTPMPNDDYEPDDTPSTATPITVGAAAQSHVLLPGDSDWFSFTAQAGTAYVIETTGNTDTYLALYDTDGVTPLDSNDDGGTGANARIAWTSSTANLYFFMVRGYDSEEAGIYGISVVSGSVAKGMVTTLEKAAKKERHSFFKR